MKRGVASHRLLVYAVQLLLRICRLALLIHPNVMELDLQQRLFLAIALRA